MLHWADSWLCLSCFRGGVVRFLIAEHALLLLKVVIAAAVDDVPQDVQEQVRVSTITFGQI